MKDRATLGIPVQIDEDTTPLPVEPPDPTKLTSFASLPLDVRAHLMKMHDTQREQDVAIARMWNVRNLDEEVSRLTGIIGGLSQLASVPELLRIQGNRMEMLIEWKESSNKDSAKLEVAVRELGVKLSDTRELYLKIEGAIQALSGDLGRIAASLKGEIEGVGAELAALEEKTSAEIAALAKRLAMLEEYPKRARWTIAVLVVLGGLVTFFAKLWTSAK